MRALLSVLVVVLVAVLVVGCDAEPQPGESDGPSSTSDPQPEVEPTIELGAGLTDWRPLADGDTVELVAGFQGGWHIDLGVRGKGIDPEGLSLRYEARDPQTDASLSHETKGLLTTSNVLPMGDSWLRVGDRVVFTIDQPETVVGSEVCLYVRAYNASWEGGDSRCVTIVDDEP